MRQTLKSRMRAGFALPTVLIASVVMLTILSASVAAVTATRSALQNQYYDTMAQDAADAGLEMAKACIAAGTNTWANPLRPNGTCAGLAAQCTAATCYVVSNTNVRTTFEVSTPTVANNATTLRATGKVERLRTSNGAVIRTYEQATKMHTVVSAVHNTEWKSVAVGATHSCALSHTGKVYCWGDNAQGQLGNGTTTASNRPVAIAQGALPAGMTIREIAAGDRFTCAIASNNQVYCWGLNSSRQLADGTTTARSVPTLISQGALPSGYAARGLTVGTAHSCVLASNGQAYCWGVATNGRLGNNATSPVNTPVQVQNGSKPAAVVFTQLSAGDAHTCGVAANGQAFCWGNNATRELGDGTTSTQQLVPATVALGAMPAGSLVQQISAGSAYSCAVTTGGSTYCWGANNVRQLGDGSSVASRPTATAIAQGSLPSGYKISKVITGYEHTCVVSTLSALYCWGGNTGGKVGNGATSTVPTATSVAGIGEGAVRLVGGGRNNTCAVGDDKQIYCWGVNTNTQIGNGQSAAPEQTTPAGIAVVPDASVRAEMNTGIAISGPHSCSLGSDLWVYCWGDNEFGQLGNSTTSDQSSPVAVSRAVIPTSASIWRITSNGSQSCAVASNGRAYCWGNNSDGRLGDGTTSHRTSAVAVLQGAMPAGSRVVDISTGGAHTCAVVSDLRMYCWGDNPGGQLGDGTTTRRTSAVAVVRGAQPAAWSVVQMANGGDNPCAIASDLRAYCWGFNSDGQLGDGTTTNRTSPVAVSVGDLPAAYPQIQRIANNGRHACAIGTDNWVYCWGNNNDGQLGDGTTTNRTTPKAVLRGAIPSGIQALSVSVGYYHTCIVAMNYKIYCWGANPKGELGDGSNEARYTPVEVQQGALPSGVTFREVAAGDYHTCALASNEKAYCWGGGADGQNGDGTTLDRPTPVLITQFPVFTFITVRTLYL